MACEQYKLPSDRNEKWRIRLRELVFGRIAPVLPAVLCREGSRRMDGLPTSAEPPIDICPSAAMHNGCRRRVKTVACLRDPRRPDVLRKRTSSARGPVAMAIASDNFYSHWPCDLRRELSAANQTRP